MKTFREFITEVYDPDVVGKAQIRKQGEGGRVGRTRKQSEPEKRRMKAVGGGKMVPAKTYKDRKDIGTQRKTSDRQQQPTQARGSAALSPREQQAKFDNLLEQRRDIVKSYNKNNLVYKASASK